MAGVLFGFVASAAVVIVAGVVLARAGDVIAARTRLGGLWVGTIFLAGATSLPELTTDITAVRLGAADLAAGDLFGSSMANMLILGLVSFAPGRELFRRATLDNALGASFAIMLTCVAAISILLRPTAELFGVGAGTAALAVVYVAATAALFRHSRLPRETARVMETLPPAGGRAPVPEEPGPLRPAVLRFAGASVAILVAAPFLATSAKALAEATGLGYSFVGTWLVGLATSLPELVTSLAAVRLQAFDLAVGNLYGSNAFNMMVLAPLDLAYTDGPILGALHPVHAITALVAVALMAIGLAALVYRAKGRIAMLEPSGMAILLVYVLGLVAVYLGGRGP